MVCVVDYDCGECGDWRLEFKVKISAVFAQLSRFVRIQRKDRFVKLRLNMGPLRLKKRMLSMAFFKHAEMAVSSGVLF